MYINIALVQHLMIRTASMTQNVPLVCTSDVNRKQKIWYRYLPRKYQYQIGIWYFCPKFLGIFLVFYRYFEKAHVKIWLIIGIFGRIKIGLVFGFCSCHFIGIGLVSV